MSLAQEHKSSGVMENSSKSTVQQSSKQTKWTVNRELLPLKMFYFFFYGACGAVIPFISVILKYLQLTASETGLITGLSVIFAMVARTVIGMLADKLRARKTALIICCLGFGSAFSAMGLLPMRTLGLNLSDNTTLGGQSILGLLNISQQSAHSLQVWICTSPHGTEICRYPGGGNHIPCQIKHKSLSTNDNVLPDREQNFLPENQDEIASTSNFEVSKPNNRLVEKTTSFSDKNKEFQTQNEFKDTRGLKSDTWQRGNHSTGQFMASTGLNVPFPCLYLEDTLIAVPTHTTKTNAVQGLENAGTFLHSKINSQNSSPENRSPLQQNENAAELPAPGMKNPFQRSETTEDSVQCLTTCRLQGIDPRNETLSRYSSEMTSIAPAVDSSVTQIMKQYKIVTGDLVFCLSFILVTGARCLYSASTSLADAVAYTIMGPYSLQWGHQRLWGTLGTALVGLIATFIIDRSQNHSYLSLYVACLSMTVIACFIGISRLRADKAPKNPTFSKDLRRVLRSSAVQVLLCKLLFVGFMCGTAQNFFFWFLLDMGGSHLTLGICLLLYCAASVFWLGFSGQVIRKIGQNNVIIVVLLAYVIRYLVFSFLTSAWLALCVEYLHGITYSMLWAAASSTASRVAPRGSQATCQAIAGAVYWDLGRGLGNLVSGQFLELIGARWTFRAYSLACAIALPLFWCLDKKWSLQQIPHQGQQDQVEVEVPERVQEANRDVDATANQNLLGKDGVQQVESPDDEMVKNIMLTNNNTYLSNLSHSLTHEDTRELHSSSQSSGHRRPLLHADVERAQARLTEYDTPEDHTPVSRLPERSFMDNGHVKSCINNPQTICSDLTFPSREMPEFESRNSQELAVSYQEDNEVTSFSLEHGDTDSLSSSDAPTRHTKMRPKSDSLIPFFSLADESGGSREGDTSINAFSPHSELTENLRHIK